jgi:N-acetylmuramoyl-L-alanine amidase
MKFISFKISNIKVRTVFKLFVLIVVMAVLEVIPAVQAQTDNIYKKLNSPLYSKENACTPATGTDTPSGEPTTTPMSTGEAPQTASDALAAQPGLDKRWSNLILKYANKYGADPIAMASILYWENRGFPAYKISGWSDDPSSGMGPWQFTQATWNNYEGDVDDPVASTKAAAQFIKSAGGKAGSPGGSIEQDFSKGKNLPSMATVMKVYNAGLATYRDPGIAKHLAPERLWYEGSAGPWGGDKPKIIDDYIVAGTYIYFQIATGQKVTYSDTDSYVREALTKQDQIKAFAFGGAVGSYTDSDSTGSCISSECSASSTTSGNTIVVDPGHIKGSTPSSERDPITGLYVEDYDNPTTERRQVYDASVRIADKLKAAGFNVVNTKGSLDDQFNLAERAAKINNANPILAITLHGDAGATWLGYPDNQSTRVPHDGPRKDGKNGLVYPEIAEPSKNFATQLAPIIAQKTGTSSYTARTFNDIYPRGIAGNGLNPGNTPVQTILQKVPSVYSEFPLDKLNDNFADAVADAIIQVVKPNSSGASAGTTSCTGGVVAGSIVETAINLSWPTDHGLNAKPEYREAVEKYNSSVPFSAAADCGVFVATVMHASGADPDYPPSGTSAHENYVRTAKKDDGSKKYDVYENINSTADLQPGDILIVNGAAGGAGADGHTFIFIGKQDDGNNQASASLGSRMPSRGTAPGNLVDPLGRGHYIVARLR